MSTVQLRQMRWWDVTETAALDRSLFVGTSWSDEVFWSELAGVPDARYYLVAVAEQEIVGFGGAAFHGPDADIQTLGVARSHRRSGVATQILTSLLTQVRERGVRTVFLDVRADNEAALQLYGRHGFVPIDRRTSYYGTRIDAVVMRARLDLTHE